MIYQDLTSYITPFALLKIDEQYCRLADKSQLSPLCTHQFTTTIRLPYVYRIEVSFIVY